MAEKDVVSVYHLPVKGKRVELTVPGADTFCEMFDDGTLKIKDASGLCYYEIERFRYIATIDGGKAKQPENFGNRLRNAITRQSENERR